MRRSMSLTLRATRFLSTILSEGDLTEKFVRGSGPGGQSINKTRNKVQLTHLPTGLRVECQETRDLRSNRLIARKVLQNKIELLIKGEDSKIGKKIKKIQKQKYNSARRARKKYGDEEEGAMSPQSSTRGDDDEEGYDADEEDSQTKNPVKDSSVRLTSVPVNGEDGISRH